MSILCHVVLFDAFVNLDIHADEIALQLVGIGKVIRSFVGLACVLINAKLRRNPYLTVLAVNKLYVIDGGCFDIKITLLRLLLRTVSQTAGKIIIHPFGVIFPVGGVEIIQQKLLSLRLCLVGALVPASRHCRCGKQHDNGYDDTKPFFHNVFLPKLN